MNKRIVKIVSVVVILIIVGICVGVLMSKNTAAKCETDLYSVNISKEWSVESPFDDLKNFIVDNDMVAYIEIFRDCSYDCVTAESIAVNVFGTHGSLLESEETVVGDWTRYKMVIGYELSAAQQMEGEAIPASEVHYIYTNKQDTFVDIYVNEEVLTDDEIQRFLNSFEINET